MSRKRDIRKIIISAAKNVFATNGYGSTSVEDILREAKVARATFYTYFTSKRHVFVELLKEFLNSLYENTINALDFERNNPPDLQTFTRKLESGLVFFYRYFVENDEIVRVYYSEAFGKDASIYAIWDEFDRRMTRELSRIIENGIWHGIFRPVKPELVAQALLMIFIEVPYRYMMVHRSKGINVEELARQMVSFVMTGIARSEFPVFINIPTAEAPKVEESRTERHEYEL